MITNCTFSLTSRMAHVCHIPVSWTLRVPRSRDIAYSCTEHLGEIVRHHMNELQVSHFEISRYALLSYDRRPRVADEPPPYTLEDGEDNCSNCRRPIHRNPGA